VEEMKNVEQDKDERREAALKLAAARIIPYLKEDKNATIFFHSLMSVLSMEMDLAILDCGPTAVPEVLKASNSALYLLASVFSKLAEKLQNGAKLPEDLNGLEDEVVNADPKTAHMYHQMFDGINQHSLALTLLIGPVKPESVSTAINCALLSIESGLEFYRTGKIAEARVN
jgi:hypothetical protein